MGRLGRSRGFRVGRRVIDDRFCVRVRLDSYVRCVAVSLDVGILVVDSVVMVRVVARAFVYLVTVLVSRGLPMCWVVLLVNCGLVVSLGWLTMR